MAPRPSASARLRWLALCLLSLAVSAAPLRAANTQPITIKELCLLLRGGYTGDEVLRETRGRPLLEPLDAAAEKSLLAAGADARLVAALKTSQPTLTDAEATAARQRQADLDRRSLVVTPNAGTAPALPAAPAPTPVPELGQVANQFRNQLVIYKDDHWQPYDASTLAGKQLFLLYFAAQGNPQCRQFTPQLLQFYRDFAPKHPGFEVVFYSLDSSPGEMEDDVRQNAMPWPALAFEREAQQPDLMAFGKQGIPRLMLIDGARRLVADSFAGGKYVGPQHVLDELTRLANAQTASASGTPKPAPAATPAATPNPQMIANHLRGKLVKFQNGSFVPLDLNPLDRKQVIAFYFTTYVSAPGKQFVPDLVKFYKRTQSAHPEFEVVAVSNDRSVYDMENMMRSQQMPWPAVRFDQVRTMKFFTSLFDPTGASRLVVLNNQGQYLADYSISLSNSNVANVLDDLEKVLADPTKPSMLAPPTPNAPALPPL